MENTAHIEILHLGDRCTVAVRDAELFDFLDDLFAERGVTAEVVFPANLQERYQLVFPPDVSEVVVRELLAQVPVADIERIVRINSGGAHAASAT